MLLFSVFSDALDLALKVFPMLLAVSEKQKPVKLYYYKQIKYQSILLSIPQQVMESHDIYRYYITPQL